MDDLPSADPCEVREPPRDGGPQEAAFYIEGALRELSAMARLHRHDLLGYLLDMAHLEAAEAVRRGQRDPLQTVSETRPPP